MPLGQKSTIESPQGRPPGGGQQTYSSAGRLGHCSSGNWPVAMANGITVHVACCSTGSFGLITALGYVIPPGQKL